MNVRHGLWSSLWMMAALALPMLQCGGAADSEVSTQQASLSADDHVTSFPLGASNDSEDPLLRIDAPPRDPSEESHGLLLPGHEGPAAAPPAYGTLAVGAAASGHAISGLVGGTIAGGVTIRLGGAATSSLVTDTAGNYSFPGLAAGSYTVTPSLAGYGFYPTSISASLGATDLTGQSFVSTIPLLDALLAQKHAIYRLTGPVSFSYASASLDGSAYTQQQAQNFVMNKLSALQVYLTDRGIRAYNPNYYDQFFAVAQNTDGSTVLSMSRIDKTPAEILTLRVRGTNVTVGYSYAWAYRTYGTLHIMRASGEFNGLLWGYPEASWIPSPAYDLRGAILSDKGVYLTWQDDNPPGTIARYAVYRDGGTTPIATVTERAYADHAVRTNEDVLRCRNLLCTISYRVVAVPASGNPSNPSVPLDISSLNGRAQNVPGCRSNADCPGGFACYSDGLCRQ